MAGGVSWAEMTRPLAHLLSLESMDGALFIFVMVLAGASPGGGSLSAARRGSLLWVGKRPLRADETTSSLSFYPRFTERSLIHNTVGVLKRALC